VQAIGEARSLIGPSSGAAPGSLAYRASALLLS